MCKKIIFTILLYIFIIDNVFADIKKINNFFPIEQAIQVADKNTLVIFDIDEVLITPFDDYNLRHPYREKLSLKLKKKYSLQHRQLLESIILSNTRYYLVDPFIIKIFDDLRKYNIPTIALTAVSTGNLGIIDNLENMKIKLLKNMGLDFLKLPPTPLKDYTIAKELANVPKLIPDFFVGVPVLKSGIIFSAGIDKGIVLEYFLKKRSYYPKTIIFVDDYLPNLQSLEKLCNKWKIKFYGFHYTGVPVIPSFKINKKLENLRFKILETEYCWVNLR